MCSDKSSYAAMLLKFVGKGDTANSFLSMRSNDGLLSFLSLLFCSLSLLSLLCDYLRHEYAYAHTYSLTLSSGKRAAHFGVSNSEAIGVLAGDVKSLQGCTLTLNDVEADLVSIFRNLLFK